MNRLLLFTLLSLLIWRCSSPPNQTKESLFESDTYEIPIQVKTTDTKDLEIFEDGMIPWISIKDPNGYLDKLIAKDEIILKSTKALLIIDYPLNKPVEINITSQNKEGFSRAELVQLISSEYNRVYEEEEESATVKTTPLDERDGLINRNATDGKYGIWGHDIEDLDLSAIIVHLKKDSIPILELYIES